MGKTKAQKHRDLVRAIAAQKRRSIVASIRSQTPAAPRSRLTTSPKFKQEWISRLRLMTNSQKETVWRNKRTHERDLKDYKSLVAKLKRLRFKMKRGVHTFNCHSLPLVYVFVAVARKFDSSSVLNAAKQK